MFSNKKNCDQLFVLYQCAVGTSNDYVGVFVTVLLTSRVPRSLGYSFLGARSTAWRSNMAGWVLVRNARRAISESVSGAVGRRRRREEEDERRRRLPGSY